MQDKLEAEHPAILRWMLDGALDWQANGLIRPDVVKTTTAEYFAEQDTVHQWIEDCCEVTERPPHTSDTNKSLFESWRNYAIAHGEAVGGSKGFSERLKILGFQPIKDTLDIRGRGFAGIKVRVYEPPIPEYDR